mmetsp:Transcript_46199/g.128824  ORF Transcript_46199/g.128824 Transcript_46199/m.128824 type:complete len:219 (-) Transcript_46199:1083-1739(-)
MTSVASSRRVAAFLTTALLVGGASSFIPGSATGLLKLRYKAALPSARNRPYHVSRSVIHAKLPKLGDRTDGEIASAPRFAMPTLPGLSKAAVAMALAASLMMSPAPALSADGAAIGKCLLKSCQLELAKCVTNPKCAANLLCIQTCNGRADEVRGSTVPSFSRHLARRRCCRSHCSASTDAAKATFAIAVTPPLPSHFHTRHRRHTIILPGRVSNRVR